MEQKREKLGSRLGFILLSAGCAIGMGNVWKFPWMTGQYGGAAFVIIYIIFLVILGLPVMTVEFTLGRAAQKSPVKMYQELEPKGSKWHIHGIAAYVANWLLMMFYTVVTGWMFYYFISMITGKFEGSNPDAIEAYFGNMVSSPKILIISAAVVVVLGFVVLAMGVQNGLEKVTKVMMVMLLGLMVVLAVNSFTLPGGGEGLKFYLLPNLDNMRAAGIGNVVVAAMNQAFFTLSLGIGSMAIFGSYLDKDRSLLGEAVNVTILDTFVAICAGLIIFPACSAFGVETGAGPSLIFVTLPNIFVDMRGGRIWGSLFFLFMSFAAFSTILAVYENIVACTMELFNIPRKKACVFCGLAMFVLALPCALGFNVWSGFQPLGEGTGVMDLEDFLVSNISLPIGSLIFVLFVTLRKGFGWDKFLEEANTGVGLKFPKWIKPYLQYVLPVIILVIFVMGMISIFG